jgi:hypothetical protein
MGDIWNEVRALKGDTIQTVTGRTFGIADVTDDDLTAVPTRTKKPIRVTRRRIEEAFDKPFMPAPGAKSRPRDLLALAPFTRPYVAAIYQRSDKTSRPVITRREHSSDRVAS